MLTLAIIPARGGSKGVTRKNLRVVGGRSLLARAVEGARGSGVVDRVVVSTDDPAIREEGLRCGAEAPFIRPAHLATDEASTVDVVIHAVETYEATLGLRVGTTVLIEPTSPFRGAEHIRAAVLRYREGGVDAVVSVCPLERKPENIFVKEESGRVLAPYVKKPRERFTTRQQMEHLCRANSAVYVCGRDAFLARRTFFIEPLGYIEMSLVESLNIDGEFDLKLAEFVAREYGL